MGDKRAVSAAGAEPSHWTLGEAGHPAVMLIGGVNPSMNGWDQQFCDRLAAGGRFVIRYDIPDTGRPTRARAAEPGAAVPARVADVVEILDALGRVAAHVVGGPTSVETAVGLTLQHPDRVQTLTLFAGRASAVGPDGPTGARNSALVEGGASWRDRLGEITVPTLIVSAGGDRGAPTRPGAELAAEIGPARLFTVPALEQDVARQVWDVLVPAVLRLTSPSWQTRADVLAERAIAADDPTGWFDQLYGAATRGAVSMPWDRESPQPQLAEWLDRAGQRDAAGEAMGAGEADGRRAVVVGCGLGADPEFLSQLGYRTTAFDISPTAISIARSRHPASSVAYSVQDLFDLPVRWSGSFGLVVEIYTVQALPLSLRRQAIAAVANLVSPGGTAVVIQAAREDEDTNPGGPPWPLTRAELELFAGEGLAAVRIERLVDADGATRWRAEFTRPRRG